MAELDWTCGELAEGLQCYYAEEFFDAHEHWENVWLQLQGPEKVFLQGLIQLTVAFHHYRRGNQPGMKSMLQAALRKLELYTGSFGGIAVTSTCNEIREWLKILETGETPVHLHAPRIRLSTGP
jgi:uncharacterized protein